MLTVAIRGPLAVKMRELAESIGMSLAKLLGDMVCVSGRLGTPPAPPRQAQILWAAARRQM